MLGIPDMMLASLAAAVALRTGKIIKNEQFKNGHF